MLITRYPINGYLVICGRQIPLLGGVARSAGVAVPLLKGIHAAMIKKIF